MLNRDVHRCEVDNGSHHDDNIKWDTEERKCSVCCRAFLDIADKFSSHIIDFEHAELESLWKESMRI